MKKSGVTHFDNVIYAMLQIFVIVTLEGWSAIMYSVQQAFSQWVWPYFLGVTFFLSVFALQLTLAVIEGNFVFFLFFFFCFFDMFCFGI